MRLLLTSIIILLMASIAVEAGPIDLYEQYYALATIRNTGVQVIALRKFRRDGNTLILTINPVTLQSAVYSRDSLALQPAGMETMHNTFRSTPYCRLLAYAESRANRIRNAGVIHLPSRNRGSFLTVDMCPSARPMERRFFTDLLELFLAAERPVPVAIAVTGIWMEKHDDDITWLRKLERDGKISITWINHTYSHRSRKDMPLRKNFLLADQGHIEKEILMTEKVMIERNMQPSVFFRFPGLVSDLRLFNKITGFGLIPIGTDAWLAKNQWPRDGSIILVHGNGNEPQGIKKFLFYMKNRKGDMDSHRWTLYDLRDGARNLCHEKGHSPFTGTARPLPRSVY